SNYNTTNLRSLNQCLVRQDVHRSTPDDSGKVARQPDKRRNDGPANRPLQFADGICGSIRRDSSATRPAARSGTAHLRTTDGTIDLKRSRAIYTSRVI